MTQDTTTTPVMASDTAALVEVTQAARDDHKRGCQGREYTCTCGHDDVVADAIQSLTTRIAELEAENGRLRDGLKRIGLLGLHNEQFPSDQAVWGGMATIARATLTETSDDR